MKGVIFEQMRLSLRWALRDRVLHAVLGVGIVMLLLVPLLSSFSMRQVQESALTLVLSISSFVSVIVAILLGSSAVVRDIEQRYAVSVLALPVPRWSFLVGRFLGIAVFLLFISLLFMGLSLLIVPYSALINPPDRQAVWSSIVLAITFDGLKAVLVAAVAILLSCFSTSFVLPFFVSIGLLLAGSASQQVYDFIHSSASALLSPWLKSAASLLYFCLPNFSAFDLHLQATYALPLHYGSLFITFSYFVVYTSIVLLLSCLAFSRREII